MPETRIFSTFAGGAFFNMAFDEWLLSRALGSPGSIFVRLYTWKDPAITFGYGQKRETALDFTRLGNTPVVRRITGGRALLHDPSELTYAIAANTEREPGSRMGQSVSQSSRLIASYLSDLLSRLGIESDYLRQSSPEERNQTFFQKAPCFESYSRHELRSQGRKVVASAQKRLEKAFLQHGSVKWRGLAPHPALSLGGRVASAPLQPVVKKELAQAASLLRGIFEEQMNLSLNECGLTELEELRLAARALEVEKKTLTRRGIIAQIQNRESL